MPRHGRSYTEVPPPFITDKIGPSITPLTNLNSGFRVYEVDSVVCPAFYVCVKPSLTAITDPVRLLTCSDVRNPRCAHVSVHSIK